MSAVGNSRSIADQPLPASSRHNHNSNRLTTRAGDTLPMPCGEPQGCGNILAAASILAFGAGGSSSNAITRS
jgi:hypothetical protein